MLKLFLNFLTTTLILQIKVQVYFQMNKYHLFWVEILIVLMDSYLILTLILISIQALVVLVPSFTFLYFCFCLLLVLSLEYCNLKITILNFLLEIQFKQQSLQFSLILFKPMAEFFNFLIGQIALYLALVFKQLFQLEYLFFNFSFLSEFQVMYSSFHLQTEFPF